MAFWPGCSLLFEWPLSQMLFMAVFLSNNCRLRRWRFVYFSAMAWANRSHFNKQADATRKRRKSRRALLLIKSALAGPVTKHPDRMSAVSILIGSASRFGVHGVNTKTRVRIVFPHGQPLATHSCSSKLIIKEKRSKITKHTHKINEWIFSIGLCCTFEHNAKWHHASYTLRAAETLAPRTSHT